MGYQRRLKHPEASLPCDDRKRVDIDQYRIIREALKRLDDILRDDVSAPLRFGDRGDDVADFSHGLSPWLAVVKRLGFSRDRDWRSQRDINVSLQLNMHKCIYSDVACCKNRAAILGRNSTYSGADIPMAIDKETFLYALTAYGFLIPRSKSVTPKEFAQLIREVYDVSEPGNSLVVGVLESRSGCEQHDILRRGHTGQVSLVRDPQLRVYMSRLNGDGREVDGGLEVYVRLLEFLPANGVSYPLSSSPEAEDLLMGVMRDIAEGVIPSGEGVHADRAFEPLPSGLRLERTIQMVGLSSRMGSELERRWEEYATKPKSRQPVPGI